MHGAAYLWVHDHAPDVPGHVLDIGGRDVNGNVRAALRGYESWTSLDIAPGHGVDIVADAGTWTPDRSYDTVLCLETFEHADNWRDIVRTIRDALSPDGYAILTMAGPGRAPHSAVDGGPLRPGEYYGNVHPDELAKELADAGFTDIHVDTAGADVRAVCW